MALELRLDTALVDARDAHRTPCLAIVAEECSILEHTCCRLRVQENILVILLPARQHDLIHLIITFLCLRSDDSLDLGVLPQAGVLLCIFMLGTVLREVEASADEASSALRRLRPRRLVILLLGLLRSLLTLAALLCSSLTALRVAFLPRLGL